MTRSNPPAPDEPVPAPPHRSGARRAAWIAGAAGVIVVAAVAVPRLLVSPDEEPAAPPAPDTAAQAAPDPTPTTASAPASAPAQSPPAVPASPAAADVIEVSDGGDLGIEMKYRWSSSEVGERILAKVRVVNRSRRAVHLPAPGEPNQGLALVVLDGEGREVRRVVETSREVLPRTTIRLDPGTAIEWPVTVVADGEAPLVPAEYSTYAEFRSDPALARLGLPVWEAPKGPIRSDRVPLVVTAK
jgi:hypothetical protein